MNAKYYYFNAPSLQNVKNALIHILGVLPVDLAKDSDVPLLIQGPLLWRSPTQSIYKPQCTSSFSSQKIFPDIHALPFRYSWFPSLQNTPLSCVWIQVAEMLLTERSHPAGGCSIVQCWVLPGHCPGDRAGPASVFASCFAPHQVLGSQLCPHALMGGSVMPSLIFNVIALNLRIYLLYLFLEYNFSCADILTPGDQNCSNSRLLAAVLNSRNSYQR